MEKKIEIISAKKKTMSSANTNIEKYTANAHPYKSQ